MKRRMVAVALAATMAISVAAGWLASARIRSPAEVAARTAAPAAAPILAPVEARVLSSDVVTRGTARFGSPLDLALAPSALKSTVSVVDTVPLAGAELREGDIALTASGRPVFILEGAQPAFRDLGPGMEGNDVLQLQEALIRIGYDPGAADGKFGDATAAAVTAWYEDAGYEPVRATTEQLAAIRQVEAELANARLEILTAKDSVVAARGSVDAAQSQLTAANAVAAGGIPSVEAATADAAAANIAASAEVAARQVALDEARAGGVAVPAAAADIAAAEADLAAAQSNATAVKLAGRQAVADAQTAADSAPAAIDAAQDAAAADDAVAVADVAAKLLTLDTLIANPNATSAEKAAAEADLAGARANAETVRITGEQAVAAAVAAKAGADRALLDSRAEAAANDATAQADIDAKQTALDSVRAGTPAAPPNGSQIAAAEADLAVAIANAETVRLTGEQAIRDAEAAAAKDRADADAAAIGAATAESQLTTAQQLLSNRAGPADALALELASTKRAAGVQVAADEVIFVPSPNVRVADLKVTRGSDAAGIVMSVTDAAVSVDGALPLADLALVGQGMEVFIAEPDLGIEATGTIERIADSPGTNGVDGFHVHFEVGIAEPPANLVGASVRVTIPVESTGGEVLAVPASAVTLAIDGTSRVEKDRNGNIEIVTVAPGLSAAGYVGVEVLSGTLEPGDLVVVGSEPQRVEVSQTQTADTAGSGP